MLSDIEISQQNQPDALPKRPDFAKKTWNFTAGTRPKSALQSCANWPPNR